MVVVAGVGRRVGVNLKGRKGGVTNNGYFQAILADSFCLLHRLQWRSGRGMEKGAINHVLLTSAALAALKIM